MEHLSAVLVSLLLVCGTHVRSCQQAVHTLSLMGRVGTGLTHCTAAVVAPLLGAMIKSNGSQVWQDSEGVL